MDSVSYLRIARGRWKIIAALCLVGIVAGWFTTPARVAVTGPGAFTATHTLRVEESDDARSRSGSVQNLEVTALMATVGDVPERAAAALGIDEAELTAMLQTRSDPAVGTVSILATAADRQRAVDVANTVAGELLAVLGEQAQQAYTAEVEEKVALVAELQAELDALPASTGREDPQRSAVIRRFEAASDELQRLESQGTPTSGLISLQEATPQQSVPAGSVADSPARDQGNRRSGTDGAGGSPAAGSAAARPEPEEPPSRPLRMLVGGLTGLLLGAGLALARERFDPRIRSREAAEQAFGLPVLAEVPPPGRRQRRTGAQLAMAAEERTLEAEAYRVLRTALLFKGLDGSRSPGAADGTAAARGGGNGPVPGVIAHAGDLASVAPGLPLLSSVPDVAGWRSPPATASAVRNPPPPVLGAHRRLWASLQASGFDGHARTLLVTSPLSGDGRTTVAANLGATLARAGRRVIVVDCDLRRPRLHEVFGISGTAGLTSMATGAASVSVACQAAPGEDRLSVVPAGPPPDDPPGFWTSDRAAEVLATLVAQSDIVVLDAPPALEFDDALALAGLADGAVVVVKGNQTPGPALRRTLDMLDVAGSRLVGAVLNEAPLRGGAPPGPSGLGAGPAAPALPGQPVGVILVTSPGAGEGKTTTVANLSAAFAESGRDTLAMDLDLRRPRLHEFFSLPFQPGLSDVLASGSPRLADVVQATSIPGLSLAPSGAVIPGPAGLLTQAPEQIAAARRGRDVVVVDTPPVLAASDAGQLLAAADGAVVVCRMGATPVDDARRTAERLARLGAPILGVVVIGAPVTTAARTYYKSYRSAVSGSKNHRAGVTAESGTGARSPTQPAVAPAPSAPAAANGTGAARTKAKASKKPAKKRAGQRN
ncbi:MAG TPA: CpsD/CapB family tyrosine-protein kinase [Acidimicrobiales bacterium]|nr:CpsD/CapB family tyrosine-protein kinase [Acidimicrobiales bacterium]